jgi:GNAT superfamily N-acetyltransferase
VLRPLTVADLDEVTGVYDRSNEFRAPMQRFAAVVEHFCATDPDGVWVAEVDGRIAGFAISARRGPLWSLPMLFIDPEQQSRGVGSALLERALETSRDAEWAVIMSSDDSRALRAYAGAGFRLQPVVKATGPFDPSRAPPDTGAVRHGGLDDLPLLEEIDRAVRGSTRSADVRFLLEQGAALLVSEDGAGYAVHFGGEEIVDPQQLVLSAATPAAATSVLWAALAELGPSVALYALTSEQQWAIDVAFRARLEVAAGGPLMYVRGRDYPSCWIASGVFF